MKSATRAELLRDRYRALNPFWKITAPATVRKPRYQPSPNPRPIHMDWPEINPEPGKRAPGWFRVPEPKIENGLLAEQPNGFEVAANIEAKWFEAIMPNVAAKSVARTATRA